MREGRVTDTIIPGPPLTLTGRALAPACLSAGCCYRAEEEEEGDEEPMAPTGAGQLDHSEVRPSYSSATSPTRPH